MRDCKSCSVIRRFDDDPKPLRSQQWPEGLPDLAPKDQERVSLANRLFEAACDFFLLACSRGVLVTMENPKNSYFWCTKWVTRLIDAVVSYTGDFQVCMLGGDRDKWTRILANFKEIAAMNICCDKTHSHGCWGFATDSEGRRVWATSLEGGFHEVTALSPGSNEADRSEFPPMFLSGFLRFFFRMVSVFWFPPCSTRAFRLLFSQLNKRKFSNNQLYQVEMSPSVFSLFHKHCKSLTNLCTPSF